MEDAEEEELPAGTLVGDYEVQGRLGQGGMGTVYAGIHPQIGKRVAIKVLATEVAGHRELWGRFLREAQAVNRISHPGLVDIFAFGELPDGRPYLIMELLQGEPLGARLDRGPLPFAELRQIFTEILEALAAAHEAGVVHRDLKPDNVFLVRVPRGTQVKLLDFGLAKVEGAGGPTTRTGIAMGTPSYMSPEQCRGRDVDHRTDLYALGSMLYEAVTGRVPFEGSSALETLALHLSAAPVPPSHYAELPAALDRLILRALAKQPAERQGSARELLAELLAVTGTGPEAEVELRRLQPVAAGAPTQIESVRTVEPIAQSGEVAAPTAAASVAAVAPAGAASVDAVAPAAPVRPIDGERALVEAPRRSRSARRQTVLLAGGGLLLLLGGIAAGVILRERDRVKDHPVRPELVDGHHSLDLRAPPDLSSHLAPDLGRAEPDLGSPVPPTIEPQAAPAESAPAPGGAVVRTGVRNAAVWLDDTWRGEGIAVHLRNLAPGPHRLTVFARGHHQFKGQVNIESGRDVQIHAELAPTGGRQDDRGHKDARPARRPVCTRSGKGCPPHKSR